jgi:hypothetical protein
MTPVVVNTTSLPLGESLLTDAVLIVLRRLIDCTTETLVDTELKTRALAKSVFGGNGRSLGLFHTFPTLTLYVTGLLQLLKLFPDFARSLIFSLCPTLTFFIRHDVEAFRTTHFEVPDSTSTLIFLKDLKLVCGVIFNTTSTLPLVADLEVISSASGVESFTLLELAAASVDETAITPETQSATLTRAAILLPANFILPPQLQASQRVPKLGATCFRRKWRERGTLLGCRR